MKKIIRKDIKIGRYMSNLSATLYMQLPGGLTFPLKTIQKNYSNFLGEDFMKNEVSRMASLLNMNRSYPVFRRIEN